MEKLHLNSYKKNCYCGGEMCENKEIDKNSNSAIETNERTANIENGNTDTTPKIRKKGLATFETALIETKFGKFNYCIIIVCGLILANVLLETLGISFVLPVSDCDLRLTTQQKGILSAIGFAGIITSSHLWGFLADTTGRRQVIRPTIIIGFIITVISSFSNSFWLLVTLRYLNGVFISGGSAVVYAYLGEFHPTNTRSRAIMGASVIFGIGAMILPLVAWVFINRTWSFYIPYLDITYKPWRLFMVVCGIPGFICGLCLYKIPESPKFLVSINKDDEAMDILKSMFATNTGKDKSEYPIVKIADDMESTFKRKEIINVSNSSIISNTLKSMWYQTAPLFSKEFLKKTILACTLQFLIFLTSNGMYMWFPLILNSMMEYLNRNPNGRAYMCDVFYGKNIEIPIENHNEELKECNETLEISTFQHTWVLELIYAAGFAFIGLIINAVGKITILFGVLVGCGICGCAVIYVNIPMISVYLYVVLLACGLGITVVNSATVDLFPTHLRAMAVCISLMFGRLGSVVGANIVGALLDSHCESAFLFSGISLILAGFIGFLIPKPTQKMELRSRHASLVSMTGN